MLDPVQPLEYETGLLREMHPLQGYLHNCKHSIKFQDFH